TDIERVLQAINSALDELRSAAGELGTSLSTVEIRTSFTEELINTLEVGAGALTIADMNEEGANMLALQTRQQLSSTALSLANQAEQSVLSLFG
ncbi:MAG: flagellin, partial [Roseobacter sp.]